MNKLAHNISNYSFVIFQIVCLAFALFSSGIINRILSFSAIVMAFAYSVIYIKKESILISIAMFFTVMADMFLIILPINRLMGMIFFAITQSLYSVYLLINSNSKKELITSIISRLVVSIIMIVVAIVVLKDGIDATSILAMYYIVQLLHNIVYALVQKRYVFAIGLIFFMMCDIIVGLSVMTDIYLAVSTTSFIYQIAHPGFNAIWLFYIISQTLIALYVNKKKVS